MSGPDSVFFECPECSARINRLVALAGDAPHRFDCRECGWNSDASMPGAWESPPPVKSLGQVAYEASGALFGEWGSTFDCVRESFNKSTAAGVAEYERRRAPAESYSYNCPNCSQRITRPLPTPSGAPIRLWCDDCGWIQMTLEPAPDEPSAMEITGEALRVFEAKVAAAALGDPAAVEEILGKSGLPPSAPAETLPLTFEDLRQSNTLRAPECEKGDYTATDFTVELMADAGAVCKLVKRLRLMDHLVLSGSEEVRVELKVKLALRLGALVVAADRLMSTTPCSLDGAVRDCFNRKSARLGCSHRL